MLNFIGTILVLLAVSIGSFVIGAAVAEETNK